MRTTSVATFDALAPAQRLQQHLQQAGFQTIIDDESKLERFWFMSEPAAAIHVNVAESDYLGARDHLAKPEVAEGVMREAVRCPECGSSRLQFPHVTRKFFLPILEVLLMVLHIISRKFYCLDCHYTWAKQESVEPQTDELGWPRDSKLWHPKEERPDPSPPPEGRLSQPPQLKRRQP